MPFTIPSSITKKEQLKCNFVKIKCKILEKNVFEENVKPFYLIYKVLYHPKILV